MYAVTLKNKVFCLFLTLLPFLISKKSTKYPILKFVSSQYSHSVSSSQDWFGLKHLSVTSYFCRQFRGKKSPAHLAQTLTRDTFEQNSFTHRSTLYKNVTPCKSYFRNVTSLILVHWSNSLQLMQANTQRKKKGYCYIQQQKKTSFFNLTMYWIQCVLKKKKPCSSCTWMCVLNL